MPAPSGFEEQFEQYRAAAQDPNQHHDQRRERFFDFIAPAFRLDRGDIIREQFVPLIMIQRHGWIDALFRNLVFEFKRDLDRERQEGLRELQDYLSHLPYSSEHLGLLTDGLQFEVYRLEDNELEQLDAIDLSAVNAETAFLWLDSYLFSQKHVPPTASDLKRRFGSASPTFQSAARVLGSLLGQLGSTPGIEIKKRQWRLLLTRVYGSDVTSDELFVRHTYLAQLAKVLAYVARNGHQSTLHDLDTLERIINGRAFQAEVSNIGDQDFFAWILEPEVRERALSVLSGLAGSLVVYDLQQITEDLFKALYQNLVDPSTRHDLGEYYTPDWLAEITLDEIGYHSGQSLLDPGCGSGSFLFSAIRRLADQGVTGWDLINFALENIMGLDVHPLAVIVARINYYLGILPHMAKPGPSGVKGPMRHGQMAYLPLTIPIYNANALAITDETLKHDSLPVPVDEKNNFQVPVRAAHDPDQLLDTLMLMDSFAREQPRPGQQLRLGDDFESVVRGYYPPDPSFRNGVADLTLSYWNNNYRLLRQLIEQRRNGIWLYILKNQASPLVLALRRFDVVAGNPPWLSYRFIKDRTYQNEVRGLTIRTYGLLSGDETKLFTQMDLSTLFFVYCEDNYLREGGTMAFVMPRSVITGSKQHRAFQDRGMSKVVDLKGVEPLFNVEACVVVRRASDARTEKIPVVAYSGKLPDHELSLAEARPYLTRRERTFSAFGEEAVKSPYYYERFLSGANIYPRNLFFARPAHVPASDDVAAFGTEFQTDPALDTDAKAPWKGVRLEGHVDPPFWFSTLLSKHLMPFGVRQFNLVVLPLKVKEDGALEQLKDEEIRARGLVRTLNQWLVPAEHKWNELRKKTTDKTLWEWVNYQNKLLDQRGRGIFKIVFNRSGTHISAAVVDIGSSQIKAFRYPTQGLIVDISCYGYETQSQGEAHFLCALLNAPCVDSAIKPYQTRGIYRGERDIHRRPFEHCAIPPFNPENADHRTLGRISQEAHVLVAGLDLGELSQTRARAAARRAVAPQIEQIDAIGRRLLGL